MKNLFEKYKSLIIYFFVAGSGVIVQYIVGSILLRNFHFEFQKALAWGFACSVPVGFILSKIFAFDAKGSGKSQREMIKFALVTFVAGVITVKGGYYTLEILSSMFGNNEVTIPFSNYKFSPVGTVSHFAGMGFSFVFNFITHKRFTFVETGIFDKIKAAKSKN